MRRWVVLYASLLLFTTLLFTSYGCNLGTETVLNESGVSSSGNIIPILTAKCSFCHGPSTQTAGLDVTNYDSLILRVVPGDPDASLLYEFISLGEMPPSGYTQLTENEIVAVAQWILDGAPNN